MSGHEPQPPLDEEIVYESSPLLSSKRLLEKVIPSFVSQTEGLEVVARLIAAERMEGVVVDDDVGRARDAEGLVVLSAEAVDCVSRRAELRVLPGDVVGVVDLAVRQLAVQVDVVENQVAPTALVAPTQPPTPRCSVSPVWLSMFLRVSQSPFVSSWWNLTTAPETAWMVQELVRAFDPEMVDRRRCRPVPAPDRRSCRHRWRHRGSAGGQIGVGGRRCGP